MNIYRTTDYITEYENGDLLIDIPSGEMEHDSLLMLSDALDWNDCYFIGDTFNMSNYETGHLIYNAHSDKVYIFPWRCLDDLAAGESVRLYASEPTEDDRKTIAEDWA